MRRRALLAGLVAGLTTVAGCSAPGDDRATPRPPEELPSLPGEQPTIWSHDLPDDAPAVFRPETPTFDADSSEMRFVFENRSSEPMAVPRTDPFTCYRLGEQRWHRIPWAAFGRTCQTDSISDERRFTLHTEGPTAGLLSETTEIGTGRFACTVAGGPAAEMTGCLPYVNTDSARRFATTFYRR